MQASTPTRILLAALALSLAAFAANSVPPSTTDTVAKPQPKKSTTTTHKHAAHKSAAHKSTSTKTTTHGKKTTRASKKHGQQVIDHDRARAIQEALIREHYLQGQPSGSWDAATQAAMQRYQADQGWQSKTTPDSRALIKLGLGPNNDHLLNPESAMTTATTSAATPVADTKTATKPVPAANPVPQQ
jgi:hypothetical protein